MPTYSDEGLLNRLLSCKEFPHCLSCCCFVHLLLMWICALLISKRWAALNGIKSYHHHQPGLIWESGWESEGWNQVMSFIGKWPGLLLLLFKSWWNSVSMCLFVLIIQIHTSRRGGSLPEVKWLWMISELSSVITQAAALNRSRTGTDVKSLAVIQITTAWF